MPTIGDDPMLREELLNMARHKKPSGDGCTHPILKDEGQQELPSSMQKKYPDMRLATCKRCGTTKGNYKYYLPEL